MKKLLKKIGIVVGVFLMFCLIVGIFTPSSDTHKEVTANKKVKVEETKEPEKTIKPTETPSVKVTNKPESTAAITSQKEIPTEDVKLSKYKSYLDNMGIDYSQYTDAEIETCYNDVKEYVDNLNKITTYEDMMYLLKDNGFDIDNMSKYECYLAFDELISDDTAESINNDIKDFSNDFDGFKNYVRENQTGCVKIKGEVTVVSISDTFINKEGVIIKIPNNEFVSPVFVGDTITITGNYEYSNNYINFYNINVE